MEYWHMAICDGIRIWDHRLWTWTWEFLPLAFFFGFFAFLSFSFARFLYPPVIFLALCILFPLNTPSLVLHLFLTQIGRAHV